MKAYKKSLSMAGHRVHYIEYEQSGNMDYLFEPLRVSGTKALYCADPADALLEKRLTDEAVKAGIVLNIDPTPSFLTDPAWFRNFFENTTHYSMTSFYIAQRKRLGILLNKGKPEGGKWTFDTENRAPLPATVTISQPTFPASNVYVNEAIDYVQRRFPDNPGDISSFFYPATHDEAMSWLQDFLETRIVHFGKYQDAIRKDQVILFHSILSPALNIGLLMPDGVVRETLNFAQTHANKIPLTSLEGFVRQIIGWREFVRAVYLLKGSQQRSTNFWGHTRKLPESFYTATTGVEPVDTTIRRLQKHAYTHHIERLMVLGNFMLLCEIDPDEVYRWFMEMFIDAYDWVMVPNIYGMSQYADGGLMTTKPYISSSKYILRMSDYEKGSWCDVWDSLYWRFINKHRDVFRKNPRMSVMVSAFNRMPDEKRNTHLSIAEDFLNELY
jgi:deoxyribodipyrimidine photolyase-related protein